jgi:hypothetical protein
MAIIKLHPTSKQAKQNQEAFFGAVGKCITTWSFVDRQIFRLFASLVGINAERSAILYYHWRTIDQRLALVDKLVKHSTSEKNFLKKWRPIKNAIDDLLEVRAIIAHQPPLMIGAATRSGRASYRYAIHVEPAERNLKKGHRGLKGKERLSAVDLQNHFRSVDAVPKKLATFRAFLRVEHAKAKGGS